MKVSEVKRDEMKDHNVSHYAPQLPRKNVILKGREEEKKMI
jgi:hypothetical protein